MPSTERRHLVTGGFGDLTPTRAAGTLFTVFDIGSGSSLIGVFLNAQLKCHASRPAAE